jgi:hypothetical protein
LTKVCGGEKKNNETLTSSTFFFFPCVQFISPMMSVPDLGNLLTGAGLAIPTVDFETIQVSYPSPLHLARSLAAAGEGGALLEMQDQESGTDSESGAAGSDLAGSGSGGSGSGGSSLTGSDLAGSDMVGSSSAAALRDPAVRRAVLEAASREYVARFGDEADGSVTATFEIMYWIAWGKSSARPARRGSVAGGFSEADMRFRPGADGGSAPAERGALAPAEAGSSAGTGMLGLDGVEGVRMFKVGEHGDAVALDKGSGEEKQ